MYLPFTIRVQMSLFSVYDEYDCLTVAGVFVSDWEYEVLNCDVFVPFHHECMCTAVYVCVYVWLCTTLSCKTTNEFTLKCQLNYRDTPQTATTILLISAPVCQQRLLFFSFFLFFFPCPLPKSSLVYFSLVMYRPAPMSRVQNMAGKKRSYLPSITVANQVDEPAA